MSLDSLEVKSRLKEIKRTLVVKSPAVIQAAATTTDFKDLLFNEAMLKWTKRCERLFQRNSIKGLVMTLKEGINRK